MNVFKQLLFAVFLMLSLAVNAGELKAASNRASVITDQYIVVFKDAAVQQESGRLKNALKTEKADAGVVVNSLIDSLTSRHKAKATKKFKKAIKGGVFQMSKAEAVAMADSPDVAFIEPDTIIRKSATQRNPTWGLDRIDQSSLPLNSSYTYGTTASNVNVYIIDTGIDMDHPEFGGRASSGWDFVDDDSNANDCDGHGTHVAGTVAGTTWGVAKSAKLIGVRVLDCKGSGSNSDVIAGIDWVAENHKSPAVANMSLGGSASSALDLASKALVDAGVTLAVAAGNDNSNACNESPARAPSAITVASSTNNDARSSFSNYGSCVDLFAPGSNITSAQNGGTSEVMSGTSMASPHVAGVAALYLAVNANASPDVVTKAILAMAVNNVISNANGSPNKLLQSQLVAGYALNVNNGSGSGSYAAGAKVTISANAPSSGQTFDKWVVNSGSPSIANAAASSTTLTMPAGAVTVSAMYKGTTTTKYTLTVNSGSGGGSYTAGTKVAISANAPTSGQTFDRWVVNSGTASIANATASSTTLMMPAGAVTVAATYKTPSTGSSLSLSKYTYAANEQIVVSYSGLPGNAKDWIGIFAAGASNDQYGQWFYTNGVKSGSMAFNGLAAGNYEVRLFYNDSYTLQNKAAFTVSGGTTATVVNVVRSANGGVLEKFTSEYGSGWNASDLTDGVTTDAGWSSKLNPGVQEFIYSFKNSQSATLKEAVIHSGTAEGMYFSKDVEVWTSADGINYTKRAGGTSAASVNSLKLNLGDVAARKVKLIIRSGYRTDYWELGEFVVNGVL